MNSRPFKNERKIVFSGHKSLPGGEHTWVQFLLGEHRATWEHWGVWDRAPGNGRDEEIKEKLPKTCQWTQFCDRKGQMGISSFTSLLFFFSYLSLFFFPYPLPPPSSPSCPPLSFPPHLCLSLSLLTLLTPTNSFLFPATRIRLAFAVAQSQLRTELNFLFWTILGNNHCM